VRLNVPSRERACESTVRSLGILIGLHHAEEISFGVC
jgi:hypothetical protein